MKPRSDFKKERVAEGRKRNDLWKGLTPKEKLSSLNLRLGEGVGAERQRKKLEEAIALLSTFKSEKGEVKEVKPQEPKRGKRRKR